MSCEHRGVFEVVADHFKGRGKVPTVVIIKRRLYSMLTCPKVKSKISRPPPLLVFIFSFLRLEDEGLIAFAYLQGESPRCSSCLHSTCATPHFIPS